MGNSHGVKTGWFLVIEVKPALMMTSRMVMILISSSAVLDPIPTMQAVCVRKSNHAPAKNTRHTL